MPWQQCLLHYLIHFLGSGYPAFSPLHFLLQWSNQVTLNLWVLLTTAVMSISSRMNFLHLFLCSQTFILVPLMFPVALRWAPHAVNASLSSTSPPPHPSPPRCSLPLPPASAVITNTVSHLISNSVIQKPRTLALRKGPCFSFQSQIKSITPRSLYHSV